MKQDQLCCRTKSRWHDQIPIELFICLHLIESDQTKAIAYSLTRYRYILRNSRDPEPLPHSLVQLGVTQSDLNLFLWKIWVTKTTCFSRCTFHHICNFLRSNNNHTVIFLLLSLQMKARDWDGNTFYVCCIRSIERGSANNETWSLVTSWISCFSNQIF